MQWPPDTKQRGLGERHFRIGEVDAGQMALQVVDAHHRNAPAERQGLRRRDAHQERADQTRSGRDGDGRQVPAGDARLLEGAGDDRRHRLEVGAAGQFGDDPAEGGVQVDLAGDHGGAHRQCVIDDGRRCLVARRLDGQQRPAHRASRSASAMACCEMAPSRSTRRLRPADVDQRRGDVLQFPAIDDQLHCGAKGARDVVRRPWRRGAVAVGTGHDEHAGLLQDGAQEIVSGDADGDLGAPLQPFGSFELRIEPEGERERSGPPASGQRLRSGREGHPEGTHLVHGGGQDREVHALGPPLQAVDAAHGVDLVRPRRQPVDGVGRHHGDPALQQPLHGGALALGIGAHGAHRLRHDLVARVRQSRSGRMAAPTRVGFDCQSTPGTST